MKNRLTRIVTRTGDDGTTGLADGQRVAKDSARVEAGGAVDELNSALGVLGAFAGLPEPLPAQLLEIQHDLFDLGGELSIPGSLLITEAGGAVRILDATASRPAGVAVARPELLESVLELFGEPPESAG